MRGLAVGIAMTMYGRLEEADQLIDTLSKDKDPILRRAAMHTLALAYCGTGNNQAVRKLLHVAVSDAFLTAFLFQRNPGGPLSVAQMREMGLFCWRASEGVMVENRLHL